MEDKKKEVLVVDDDRDTRYFCYKALEKAGIHTDTAQSAEGAFKLIERNKYKVLLLDIKLPRMDGIEMLAVLKEKVPDMKIIIFTSISSRDIEITALSKGADSFLRKPVAVDQLIEEINKALSS